MLCKMLACTTVARKQSAIPLEKGHADGMDISLPRSIFRSVADRFSMRRCTAHYCFTEVCQAIQSSLHPRLVCWPATREKWQENADAFERQYGIQGCVGCVDGSHVPVKPPAHDRDSYINRKGFPSVNLMAVCDHFQRFIHTYAERAGSVHDARVFRVSDIGRRALDNELFNCDEFHLLGDLAYPLLPQVQNKHFVIIHRLSL